MNNTLSCCVTVDEISKELADKFDYTFSGQIETDIPNFTLPDNEFNIGLIVGSSGSGKSTILNSIGEQVNHDWGYNKTIASHFHDAEDAMSKFSAVGLNSVPTWFKPYSVLSNGEKFRADMARGLEDNAVFDEFTSVVDRNVAKSCSAAIQRYIRKNHLKNVVFASCHKDIIEWLQPDWVFDTDLGQALQRGSHRQPEIKLEVVPCGPEAWSIFSKHHYLTDSLNKSGKHWLCLWESVPVGFTSVMSMPSGTIKNAYRGHRTVVLPDYQGLGIGMALSDGIGHLHVSEGKRYFSKTTHPKMGNYRNNSRLWRPTSKNMKARNPKGVNKNIRWMPRKVFSYSHEYIGE